LLASGKISECQVLVVDDASSDETPILLKAYAWVETLRHPNRRGYGAALKAGILESRGDWIAFLDLDATYDPTDLEGMIQEMESSGVDIVLGERFSRGAGMPWLRGFGNSFFAWLVRQLYRYPIKDVCTGCRLFHSKWAREMVALPHDGLEYSLAMTLWSIRKGIALREISIHYYDRSGESKLRILPDGGRFLWTILRSQFVANEHAPVVVD
jgi:glycosyltransferase involved in cell wall biosynthesis